MNEIQINEEQNVIGHVLAHPEIMDKITYLLPEYFEDEQNAIIFKTMIDLKNEGMEITPLSVYKKMGKPSELSEYISSVSGILPTKQMALRYAKDIYDSGKKKYIKEKIGEITEKSENIDEEILSFLETVKNVDEQTNDFVQETIDTLQWKMNNPNKIFGIQTGISCFDEKINGFNGGCLYICAGRSSMGKSAFMTSCIARMEKEVNVGIVSLEMTGKELMNRICCVRTRIPYWVIDRGRATAEQFDKFVSEVLSVKGLHIDDRGGLNSTQVCSKIRQMVNEKGCKIVFVDHCGLIKVSDRGNLAHEIGKVTSALKSLAKELDIPIVLLCQVNRGVEDKKDMRPQLSDLRDSGRIEEDADCVFFLYRPAYYDTQKEPTRYEDAEIIIQKNRNGENGFIKCHFDNQLMFFYE